MLILPRWIQKIALWLRRDCWAVLIVLGLTPGRQLPIRIRHLECSSITPGSWSLLVCRLLYHSPMFWVDRLGEEDAMAAAVNLQGDAGIMLSNLQILSQFVMLLHMMSCEMMTLGMGHVVFPLKEIVDLSTAPRVPWAAKGMAAMGLWRPQTGPGDPGPVPASSCNACMCNELGEVNAGWFPARPASVDQDHTRNNRHNPLMV